MTPLEEQQIKLRIARGKMANLGVQGYYDWLGTLDDDLAEQFHEIASDPALTLRPKQEMPGGDWYIWLLRTGRGFGKNHAASCAINQLAEYEFPGKQGLIVGATFKDVRSTIFSGPSGLLATARPGFEPVFVEHNAEIRWPNGSKAAIRTGDNPEDIRGLSVPWAYADELIKWPKGERSWQNISMCVREGTSPRIILTSTPLRGAEWLKRLEDREDVHVTTGTSRENVALAKSFFVSQEQTVSGKAYEEEALGEWTTNGGNLWNRDQLDACIVKSNVDMGTFAEQCDERLISIDPSAGKRDLAGMMLIGRVGDTYWLLDDMTIKDPVPRSVWEAELARWVDRFLKPGDTIVVETNGFLGIDEQFQRKFDQQYVVPIHQGGGKSPSSKTSRAEKAQVLYERGLVRHFKACPLLEQQMEGFYDVVASNSESPDRVDALVIGLNYLHDAPRSVPSVVSLNLRPGFKF